jgi:hypothetical protein
MVPNPYQSPSFAASLDEPKVLLEQQQLLREAAGQFVSRARQSAGFHLVGGIVLFAIPIFAHDERVPFYHDRMWVTMWGLAPILLVWSWWQWRVNIVAVTLTGVTSLGAWLYLSGYAVVQCYRLGPSLVTGLVLLVAISLFSILLIGPIVLALEAWAWRRRSLDPMELAGESESSTSLSVFLPSRWW